MQIMSSFARSLASVKEKTALGLYWQSKFVTFFDFFSAIFAGGFADKINTCAPAHNVKTFEDVNNSCKISRFY